ncbi:MAG: biotin transporter BioY [Ruminiclostridium sp.]|nr:biotin transporter BioY [Ruminiclostridium sp.]
METRKTDSKTLTMVMCALGAAIIAVSAQVVVPLPFGVPITLQTFGVALCAAVFGSFRGTVSTAVYVLLGAVGLPVFAGMRGGFESITGPAGGFIYGFLPMAFLCGMAMKNLPLRMVVSVGGLALCYICGAVQYALLMGIDLIQSFTVVVLPFAIKDVLSIVAAQYMAIPIRKAIAKITN